MLRKKNAFSGAGAMNSFKNIATCPYKKNLSYEIHKVTTSISISRCDKNR